MTITEATDKGIWDGFIATQKFRPFLQSWTMGEVYQEVGHEPIRLEVRDGDVLKGVCQAVLVPARRGRHLAISYGPILKDSNAASALVDQLKIIAKEKNCRFLRMSPFIPADQPLTVSAKASPLHLLAEHIWYVPLTDSDGWEKGSQMRSEDAILKEMRKNQRNLIRRAEKEGVTIERSSDPVRDLPLFIELHEETRKRHSFTPYTNKFFEAQVQHFTAEDGCTLYLAKYEGEVIASSIHMHLFGETSYHHGASTVKHRKIPASYLLQWTAMQDAIKRGDHVYSFWGIAPEGAKNHPFAGVTTFKTGFGGRLLELQHCVDIPVSPQYHATRAFEYLRKWRRGF